MNTPKEYTIVSESGTNDFIKVVNDHINEGWTPIGGVSSVFVNITNPLTNEAMLKWEYSQAMVRY